MIQFKTRREMAIRWPWLYPCSALTAQAAWTLWIFSSSSHNVPAQTWSCREIGGCSWAIFILTLAHRHPPGQTTVPCTSPAMQPSPVFSVQVVNLIWCSFHWHPTILIPMIIIGYKHPSLCDVTWIHGQASCMQRHLSLRQRDRCS